MEQSTNKQHKIIYILVCFSVVMLLCAIGTIIYIQMPLSSKDKYENTETESATVLSETDLQVETPFCTLHYPMQWNASTKTMTEDLGYEYVVHFYYKGASQEAEIFRVSFGDGEKNDGYIGKISQSGVQTAVCLKIIDAEDIKLNDETEINQIRKMQADTDYLVNALNDDPLFCAKENDSEEMVKP